MRRGEPRRDEARRAGERRVARRARGGAREKRESEREARVERERERDTQSREREREREHTCARERDVAGCASEAHEGERARKQSTSCHSVTTVHTRI